MADMSEPDERGTRRVRMGPASPGVNEEHVRELIDALCTRSSELGITLATAMAVSMSYIVTTVMEFERKAGQPYDADWLGKHITDSLVHARQLRALHEAPEPEKKD